MIKTEQHLLGEVPNGTVIIAPPCINVEPDTLFLTVTGHRFLGDRYTVDPIGGVVYPFPADTVVDVATEMELCFRRKGVEP